MDAHIIIDIRTFLPIHLEQDMFFGIYIIGDDCWRLPGQCLSPGPARSQGPLGLSSRYENSKIPRVSRNDEEG